MNLPLEQLPELLVPAARALQFTVMAAAVALVCALISGIASLAPFKVVRFFSRIYVEILRGSSAVVQVFLFFYVLPLLGVNLSPTLAGVSALGLIFGAYGSEVVRASIQNVARGQKEAAIVLGMSPALAMRRVVLPQAFVLMLPPFGNLIIELLKGTALLSLITVEELTLAATIQIQGGSDAGETYLLVLAMYFVLALPLLAFVRGTEIRLRRKQSTSR